MGFKMIPLKTHTNRSESYYKSLKTHAFGYTTVDTQVNSPANTLVNTPVRTLVNIPANTLVNTLVDTIVGTLVSTM